MRERLDGEFLRIIVDDLVSEGLEGCVLMIVAVEVVVRLALMVGVALTTVALRCGRIWEAFLVNRPLCPSLTFVELFRCELWDCGVEIRLL